MVEAVTLWLCDVPETYFFVGHPHLLTEHVEFVCKLKGLYTAPMKERRTRCLS